MAIHHQLQWIKVVYFNQMLNCIEHEAYTNFIILIAKASCEKLKKLNFTEFCIYIKFLEGCKKSHFTY